MIVQPNAARQIIRRHRPDEPERPEQLPENRRSDEVPVARGIAAGPPVSRRVNQHEHPDDLPDASVVRGLNPDDVEVEDREEDVDRCPSRGCTPPRHTAMAGTGQAFRRSSGWPVSTHASAAPRYARTQTFPRNRRHRRETDARPRNRSRMTPGTRRVRRFDGSAAAEEPVRQSHPERPERDAPNRSALSSQRRRPFEPHLPGHRQRRPGPIPSTIRPRRLSYTIRLVKRRRPLGTEIAPPDVTVRPVHLTPNVDGNRHVTSRSRGTTGPTTPPARRTATATAPAARPATSSPRAQLSPRPAPKNIASTKRLRQFSNAARSPGSNGGWSRPHLVLRSDSSSDLLLPTCCTVHRRLHPLGDHHLHQLFAARATASCSVFISCGVGSLSTHTATTSGSHVGSPST